MTSAAAVAGLTDSHMHSNFSIDSRASMEAMVRTAVGLGLREITFTEHLDLDPGSDGVGYLRFDAYLAEIDRCRALFDGRIAIRAGLEIGDVQRHGAEIAAQIAGLPLDFLIGSIHFIDGLFVGGPTYLHSRPPAAVVSDYFEQSLLAARVGGFDVHGHLDVFKRRGLGLLVPFDPTPWADQVRAILRQLIDGGMGIEINTSGVRTDAEEPCPALPIVRWYRELGGEIVTLGSDAHRPDTLGFGLEVGADLLRAAGFRRYCTFVQRRPVWHPL
jgi:histidinol-phosphatase (PHP family)